MGILKYYLFKKIYFHKKKNNNNKNLDILWFENVFRRALNGIFFFHFQGQLFLFLLYLLTWK